MRTNLCPEDWRWKDLLEKLLVTDNTHEAILEVKTFLEERDGTEEMYFDFDSLSPEEEVALSPQDRRDRAMIQALGRI